MSQRAKPMPQDIAPKPMLGSVHTMLLNIAYLPLLALQACSTTPAPTGPQMLSMWVVEPKFAIPPTGIARNGDVLFSQRLLPMGLVETTADFRAGENVIPSGTQFHRMVTSKPVVAYCSIRPRREIAAPRPDFSKYFGHVCIVDAEGDGTFEGYASHNSSLRGGIPMISGRVMAVFPASGITTVAKRPEEMRDTFVVALQHDGAPMMEDDRRIVLKFGVPYNLQTLTRPFIAEREGGRFEDLTVLGANIRFTGIAGDSLTYEVLNPMPLQPFAVSMRTETRTFYMPY